MRFSVPIDRSFVRSFVRRRPGGGPDRSSASGRRRLTNRTDSSSRSSTTSSSLDRRADVSDVVDVVVVRDGHTGTGMCVCVNSTVYPTVGHTRTGTHWDGHTGTDVCACACMCKQYGLSHIGTRVRDTLGHTGTHWDVFVCMCKQYGFMVWFGSASIHPSIHPSAADDDGSGRQTPDALRYTIIGNDDDRFGDRARRRRRRRARSRVDSSIALRFVSRRATAKKSNGRGVVKVVGPSGATRGHRDDASATDER